MADTVVDSSVIIDHLPGRERATRFLDTLRRANDLGTHVVVAAEVLVGARDEREQREIVRLFDKFRVFQIDEADSSLSIDLLKRHRLADGLGWLDCLIAATCLRKGLSVATLNDRHFRAVAGLPLSRPY